MEFLKVVLTSVLSIAILFAMAKCMGHKQVAQLDFFDYINGITIGSIAAELATELEQPWKPLVALLIYGSVSVLLTFLTRKFPKTRKYINGSPTILMDNGTIYRENLKKAKLDLSEFLLLCREQGYFDLSNIQTAVFEQNGKLTVLPRCTGRPLTPEDMQITPKQSYLFAEVIMDGRILDENLHRMGLDSNWLEKQIRAQGYRGAGDIFLGLCDRDKALSLYPYVEN